MSVFLCFLFIAYVISKVERGKPTMALLLGWMIVSPTFRVGSLAVDSTYIVVIVLFAYIMLKDKKIRIPTANIRSYIMMIMGVNILYVISWLLFSRIDPETMITDFCGALKIVLLLVECWHLNTKVKNSLYLDEAVKMIAVLAVINTIAVVYEMSDLNASIKFLSEVIFNDQEIKFLLHTTKWGYYARYFGVFGYPMRLGMFVVYSLTFLAFQEVHIKKIYKIILIADLLVLGMLSGSKTFIFGVAILLVLMIVNTFMAINQTKKAWASGLGAGAVILLIYIMFDELSILITNVFGAGFARYFNYLANIGDIFETRFSSDKGLFANSTLYDVIKSNLVFGVGVSSINSEPNMDNSILMILHNGGMVAFTIVLLWYLKSVYKNIDNKGYIYTIIIILATGMGFQTWIAPVSAWLIYVMLAEKNRTRKAKK